MNDVVLLSDYARPGSSPSARRFRITLPLSRLSLHRRARKCAPSPPRLGPYVCVRVIFCRRQGARLPRLLRTCFYVCVSIFSRILRRRHALLCRQFCPRRSLLQTMSPAAILSSFGNAISLLVCLYCSTVLGNSPLLRIQCCIV